MKMLFNFARSQVATWERAKQNAKSYG